MRIARATLRSGSSVSAAATATISVPPNANTTTSRAAPIPARPAGAKPPCAVKLDRPGEATSGNQPSSRATPTRMKATIAATLMIANQNSNSPKLRTPSRLTTVNAAMNSSASAGTDNEGQRVASRPAAPTASAAITITSCTHHSQPTVAPAVGPSASAA